MPMPCGPLRESLLVRDRSTYGYAKASWEINLGCDHDCGFCYLGEKRFEGLDWDDSIGKSSYQNLRNRVSAP